MKLKDLNAQLRVLELAGNGEKEDELSIGLYSMHTQCSEYTVNTEDIYLDMGKVMIGGDETQ